MQRKTYSLSIVLGLVIALFSCATAFATSPADDVYRPDGDVLDFVATPTPTPTSDTQDNNTCAESNGSNGSGNSGSGADNCGTTTTTTCSGTSGSAGSGGSGCGEVEQASVCGSNGTSGSSTSGSGSNGCGTTTPVVTKGQLPFTGFQAGLVGLMGLALLGGGITMRRLTRRQD